MHTNIYIASQEQYEHHNTAIIKLIFYTMVIVTLMNQYNNKDVII